MYFSLAHPPKRIILSRTDNIGDVVLTLLMAGYIKSVWPQTEIFFIGKKYTKPVISLSLFVDHFLDRDELLAHSGILSGLQADAIIFVFPDKELANWAKKKKIPVRIGTSHRVFHWTTCNKLVHFSRIGSDLHESQLNFKLLGPLGLEPSMPLTELSKLYGFLLPSFDSAKFPDLIDPKKLNIIFHPKSKGSAREWPLANFKALAMSLPKEKFQLFITGSEEEGNRIRAEIPDFFEDDSLIDLTGKFSLDEFVGFIGACDGMVACSTGPLHIAAAMGKHVVGIYPPIRPMHPGRWKPIGEKVELFWNEKNCNACRESTECACINAISVGLLAQTIDSWTK